MSRKFQVKVIPSKWIEDGGHRLDCGPYVGGAIEARELLKKHHTERLDSLTKGYNGGIYNGPQFSRNYVEDPEFGVPFLTTSTMQKADTANLPLLSKKDAYSSKLSFLEVSENMTLITCSGSIGKIAYSRKDMAGCWSNQDIMKVVADTEKIHQGYLNAFLAGRFGVPLVVSGTYGAIIQHIEPSHLADLPVPRLGAVEEKAHDLVQRAAGLRVEANRLLKEVTTDLELEIGGGPVEWEHRHVQSFAIEARSVNDVFKRLDAFHYVGYVGEAIEKAVVPLVEVSAFARALRPPIMKRNKVEESGHEFLGGSELVTLEQRSETQISNKTPNIDKFIVKPGYVLFQCVGQRYGLFGRPVLASRAIIGKAVTEAVMRLIPNDHRDAGYISVYLATEFGQRLVMRHSAGTSIPVLQEEGAEKILIFWPDAERRHSIGSIAEKAWENRALATELEDQARALVEQAIEEGGQ